MVTINWYQVFVSSISVNHSYDYRPSWSLLSPVTVINKSYLKVISKCCNFARNYYYFAKLAIFTFAETGHSFSYDHKLIKNKTMYICASML